MSDFIKPGWLPSVLPGMRILVVGASGGLGLALTQMLLDGSECVIGAHGASKGVNIEDPRVIPILRPLETESDCIAVVDEFAVRADGIDHAAERDA